MRLVARKGLITVAAAGGALAAAGGVTHADSGAQGSAVDSPGILSGNTVQVPVHVPVNVCGNTVNVISALNPASGNTCANVGGKGAAGGGSAAAQGQASDSPGIGSGNTVQAPINVPVNVCGNSVNIVGIGNPAAANGCANGSADVPLGTVPRQPPAPVENNVPDDSGTGTPGKASGTDRPVGNDSREPKQPPRTDITPDRSDERDTPVRPAAPERHDARPVEQLAETGDGMPLGFMLPTSAGLMLGGAVLYRRSRVRA